MYNNLQKKIIIMLRLAQTLSYRSGEIQLTYWQYKVLTHDQSCDCRAVVQTISHWLVEEWPVFFPGQVLLIIE